MLISSYRHTCMGIEKGFSTQLALASLIEKW